MFYRKELVAFASSFSLSSAFFQTARDSLQRYCPMSLLAARLACRSGGRRWGGVAALSESRNCRSLQRVGILKQVLAPPWDRRSPCLRCPRPGIGKLGSLGSSDGLWAPLPAGPPTAELQGVGKSLSYLGSCQCIS